MSHCTRRDATEAVTLATGPDLAVPLLAKVIGLTDNYCACLVRTSQLHTTFRSKFDKYFSIVIFIRDFAGEIPGRYAYLIRFPFVILIVSFFPGIMKVLYVLSVLICAAVAAEEYCYQSVVSACTSTKKGKFPTFYTCK